MKEALTVISLGISIISVVLVIAINWNTLRKMKQAEAAERLLAKRARLGEEMQNTEFGVLVLDKLNEIQESQAVFSKSLLHILRRDLLNTIDEIMAINRKRNTKNSKWYSVVNRLERYKVLEEVMDECYDSYTRLGGNHFITDKYEDAKAIIKATQRKAE